MPNSPVRIPKTPEVAASPTPKRSGSKAPSTTPRKHEDKSSRASFDKKSSQCAIRVLEDELVNAEDRKDIDDSAPGVKDEQHVVRTPRGTPRKEKVVTPVRRRATKVEEKLAAPAEVSPLQRRSKSPKKGPATGVPFHGGKTLFIPQKVQQVYALVKKSTGALGGNGSCGAIYGELTMHSMQRVINVMVSKCGLSSDSRFIDVGSGLGKPNFHAAQDPACRVSIGVELEEIRWKLAMYNLQQVRCTLQLLDQAENAMMFSSSRVQ
jgi:hypothetical protein